MSKVLAIILAGGQGERWSLLCGVVKTLMRHLSLSVISRLYRATDIGWEYQMRGNTMNLSIVMPYAMGGVGWRTANRCLVGQSIGSPAHTPFF